MIPRTGTRTRKEISLLGASDPLHGKQARGQKKDQLSRHHVRLSAVRDKLIQVQDSFSTATEERFRELENNANVNI